MGELWFSTLHKKCGSHLYCSDMFLFFLSYVRILGRNRFRVGTVFMSVAAWWLPYSMGAHCWASPLVCVAGACIDACSCLPHLESLVLSEADCSSPPSWSLKWVVSRQAFSYFWGPAQSWAPGTLRKSFPGAAMLFWSIPIWTSQEQLTCLPASHQGFVLTSRGEQKTSWEGEFGQMEALLAMEPGACGQCGEDEARVSCWRQGHLENCREGPWMLIALGTLGAGTAKALPLH